MSSSTIFTVGHSTRPLCDFVGLIRSFGVESVIDIRTVPRSRINPQYNLDVLPESLAQYGISHYLLSELGGLRKRSKSVPERTNAFWKNRSFHNYADYALSESFDEGLEKLIALGQARPTAIMCAEAVWWRCHRRIVADYLLARGLEVIHIMGVRAKNKATLTPAARVFGSKLHYL
jgi:uncharacterized protein (DUF488 family)